MDSTGGQALVTIFGSNAVSDDVLKRIVDCLMDDSNVLVSRIEVSLLMNVASKAIVCYFAKNTICLQHLLIKLL